MQPHEQRITDFPHPYPQVRSSLRALLNAGSYVDVPVRLSASCWDSTQQAVPGGHLLHVFPHACLTVLCLLF
jgi:hypothetical protein